MCGLTGLLCGESEGHDVIEVVGVLGVRRVESQRLTGTAPQVHQEGGVHHGNRKAALTLPLADGDVLGRASVVALHGCQNTQE